MKFLRRLLIILLIPSLGVAALLTEWSIPAFLARSISSIVEERLAAKLQYESGSVSLSRGVRLSRLVFTGTEGDTVTADSATFDIPWTKLRQFLQGKGTLADITVSGLHFTVTRNRSGRFILPIRPPKLSTLFEIQFHDGVLRYRDVPLDIDHTATGLTGAVHMSEQIQGEISGRNPGGEGGRWSLAMRPAGEDTAEFTLRVANADALETGFAQGIITRGEDGAFSAELAVEMTTPFAARLLDRRMPSSGVLAFKGLARGGQKSFHLGGEVRAESLMAGRIALTDLKATVTADEKQILVRSATARIHGGSASIRSAVLPYADFSAWSAAGRITGADAHPTTRGRLGSASVSGTLACDFDLRGAPQADHGMTGTLNLTVSNGQLNAPALDRLVRLSSDPTLKPLPFSRLNARIGLRANGLSVERLDFTGPRVSARGKALVAANHALSGEMTFLLTGELTSRIVGPLGGSLPKENGRTVVPTMLAGTLENPEVKLMMSQLVAGTAYGIAKSVAKPIGTAVNKVGSTLREIFGGKEEEGR